MKKILIIGAGRSSTALINYLIKASEEHAWELTLADSDLTLAEAKTKHSAIAIAVELNVNDVNSRQELIQDKDIVISLLPAFLHPVVAKDCILFSKNLVTASYLNDEIRELAEVCKSKGLLFMGEMGLDPGIDHMSAMEKINEIKAKGATLKAFYSYTGGLIAPESDDNPWSYKFTWNPRNVVLAGQGTAQYLKKGAIKYIPYNRLFSLRKSINVPALGAYDVYANRDSIPYRSLYGIDEVPTILRGTIRANGFCDAWNALVRLGLTDDSFQLDMGSIHTYADLVRAFISSEEEDLKTAVAAFLGLSTDDAVMQKLEWTGLFSERKIELKSASPALALEDLLLDKWALNKEDKDMIIMQHQFEYELDGKDHTIVSTMVTKGEDSINTSMAKTVGLPVAILVKNMLLGRISLTGVHIPVMPEIYEPVLAELKDYGIDFIDEEFVNQ